jgi:hypothetical protein
MAALNPVPNCLRVQLKWTFAIDLDVLCRFFVLYSGPQPTAAQLNTLAASISSEVNTNLSAYWTSDKHLTEVIITDLTSSTSAVGTWSGSVGGTASGSPLAAGTALIVKFLINRRYRGGHPRIYLPFLGASTLATDGSWNTASTAALLTAWETFMAAVLANTWTGATLTNQVNVHYFHGFTNFTYPSGRVKAIPTPLATPTTDIVAGYAIVPQPASQRRRNLTS